MKYFMYFYTVFLSVLDEMFNVIFQTKSKKKLQTKKQSRMDREPEEEIRWHPLASRDITACQQTTRHTTRLPPYASTCSCRCEEWGRWHSIFSQDPVAVSPSLLQQFSILSTLSDVRHPCRCLHRRQTFRSSTGGPMADRMADWTPTVSESSNGQDTKVFSYLRFNSNRRVVNPRTSIQQTTVKRQDLVTTVAPLSPGGFFFRRFIMFVWVGACSFWIS